MNFTLKSQNCIGQKFDFCAIARALDFSHLLLAQFIKAFEKVLKYVLKIVKLIKTRYPTFDSTRPKMPDRVTLYQRIPDVFHLTLCVLHAFFD